VRDWLSGAGVIGSLSGAVDFFPHLWQMVLLSGRGFLTSCRSARERIISVGEWVGIMFLGGF
jgi:hypothetical protein